MGKNTRLYVVVLILSLIIAAQPYYYIWWFDLFTHLIVGFSLSIVVVSFFGYIPLSIIVLYNIAILWEIFEYITKIFIIGYRDTLTDLIFTSIGFCAGIITYLSVYKKTKSIVKKIYYSAKNKLNGALVRLRY